MKYSSQVEKNDFDLHLIPYSKKTTVRQIAAFNMKEKQ
jgi:hypothetical protein